ncbi:dihydroneopterin aldolase [Xanthobacter sp. TB0136]|uniref:dihydroneopterin aldolase n=1 Tax=Xanthobacter sp. TB0136 TaxID=3459177 RepID=UPI0040392DD4
MVIRQHSISLRDLELDASIGIHHHEKARRQRVLVSVRLILDPAHVAQGDNIHTTVDYDFLRMGIQALLEQRHYNLQETLVQDILALCGTRKGVVRAIVSSRKTEAYADCDSVGYEAEAEFTAQGG